MPGLARLHNLVAGPHLRCLHLQRCAMRGRDSELRGAGGRQGAAVGARTRGAQVRWGSAAAPKVPLVPHAALLKQEAEAEGGITLATCACPGHALTCHCSTRRRHAHPGGC